MQGTARRPATPAQRAAASPAAAQPSVQASPAASTAQGFSVPTPSSTSSTPAIPPEQYIPADQIDADLRGKSVFVQQQVMARRIAQKKREEELVATYNKAEEDKGKAANLQFELSKQLRPKIEEWEKEKNTGKVKDIRALLSTMHTLFWDGIGLDPIPISKLLQPRAVRLQYLKACRVLHPDRHSPDWTPEQKFIATQVFHAIETGYSELKEKEGL